MLARRTLIALLVSTLALAIGSPAIAAEENAGLADLDRAIDVRLSAENASDLDDIIRLCESALDKGLDEANSDFARQMLAATLMQRATAIAESRIFAEGGPDRRWPQWRQAVLADVDRALEYVPQLAQAQLMRGRLLSLPGGDNEEAVAAMDAAIKYARETDDDETLALALTYRSGLEDDLDRRLALLNEAIPLAPGQTDALRARGAVLLAQNRHEEALADFDAALEIDPDHAPTLEARGLALALLERLDEARESFDRASDIDPNSQDARLQRGRVNLLTGDSRAAETDATYVLRLNPGNVAALLLRAQARQAMNKLDEALADADTAMRLAPSAPQVLEMRALLFVQAERLEDALADLNKLRELQPEDLETLFRLGVIHHQLTHPQEAIEAFTALLKIEPTQWMALRSRGDTYLQVGKHAEAVADFELALEQQPEDSGILNNLAWVLCTSPMDDVRDGERAIELATKACELTDYKQAHILSTLAAAYAETGDFETAIRWSTESVRLADEEIRDNVRKELESYQAGEPWRELQDVTASSAEPDRPSSRPRPSGDNKNDPPARQGSRLPISRLG